MLLKLKLLYFYLPALLLIIISILGVLLFIRNKKYFSIVVAFSFIGISKIMDLFFPLYNISIDENGKTTQKINYIWYVGDTFYKIGLIIFIIILLYFLKNKKNT